MFTKLIKASLSFVVFSHLLWASTPERDDYQSFLPTSMQLGSELVTVRYMKETDIDSMKGAFVKAFNAQYAQYSLEDLGKGEAKNPHTGAPYSSVREWLEVVAEGEAQTYLDRNGDPDRIDIVAVDESDVVKAYLAAEIMRKHGVAYLAQAFVTPDCQRRGAPQMFMNKMAKEVMPKDVEVYTLLVRYPHNAAAVQAHEKNGFVRLPADVSTKYALSLDYPPNYYIAMARPVNPDVDVVSFMRDHVGLGLAEAGPAE